MKKNLTYLTIYFIILLIFCTSLFIHIPKVNAKVGPHTIAGNAYYNFNTSYPAVNAIVDAHNDNTDEWIYDIDTVSSSGKWNFNVGSPSPGWSNGDQITIFIHQDNPGEYHGWNGTITTNINMESSPQIVTNCYLTFTPDSKNESDDKYNNSNNMYNDENIPNENDTVPESYSEENNTTNENTTGDIPLKKSLLIGPGIGELNRSYNYTFTLPYPINDTLHYIVDWGDNTNNTLITSVENNTHINLTHNWNAAGIYIIKTYVKENNNSFLEFENITILINVLYCNSIGFIIDNDNDKIYDSFQSNETGKRTFVEHENGNYLIDENSNGEWDYKFDIELGLSKYQKNKKTESPAFEIFNILISLCIVLLFFRRNK